MSYAFFKTGLAAAAIVAMAPVVASAATISDYNYDLFALTPVSSTYTETWEVGANAWDISGFSVTLNGSNAAAINSVTFTIAGSDVSKTYTAFDWTVVNVGTNGPAATTFIVPGFTATSDFTLTFNFSAKKPVLASYVFDAEVAPVPVPAAGGLLLAALGVAGAVSRRRKA